ncbi:MAG TPA: hypothetical protein VIO94_11170 [Phenylobacterium sp.]
MHVNANQSEPLDKKKGPSPIERASGGQHNADMAADAAPGEHVEGCDLDERQDKLLDEAVEETFPASDPISPKRIT